MPRVWKRLTVREIQAKLHLKLTARTLRDLTSSNRGLWVVESSPSLCLSPDVPAKPVLLTLLTGSPQVEAGECGERRR